MNYRNDQKTNKQLSILGFGCMRFPRARGRIDLKKSEEMILDAVSRGINYFDTAYIYPGSEEALGHIVAKNDLRKKIYIATKLPLFMIKNYDDFDKYFNKSLERLKTDYVDYYLMHMITTGQQWKNLCDLGIEKWIDEKKAQGRIKQLGFSFHGKREDFFDIIDARNWDFTMIQYNYLDINNQAGRAGLLYAAARNIPVFIMEPLLGGRLAKEKLMPEKVRKILYAEGRGTITPAAHALRWVWDHEEVTLLLSGMSSMREVDENIKTAETMPHAKTLSASEHETINNAISAFRESNKINCTGCGYCMPCQFGVNISDCFSCYNTSYTAGFFRGMKTYVQATGALASGKSQASACCKCGACEGSCPQNIEIRKSLKIVERRLEPFWFKAGIAIVRLFTGVKVKVKKKK